MTETVFTAPEPVTLTIQGQDARFPVRRILCVGRNYAAHAREMGESDREAPFFFSKPTDAAFDAGAADEATIPYPSLTSDLHHEAELAVAIGTGGSNIDAASALDHVYGYAAAIDLTRRDLQADAKKDGRPWDWAKGFDRSAPIGPIGRVEDATDFSPDKGSIRLSVDNVMKQDADLSEQIWGVADVIAHASKGIELKPGDIILTGTPAGVGPVERGETLRCQIEGLPDAVVTIAE